MRLLFCSVLLLIAGSNVFAQDTSSEDKVLSNFFLTGNISYAYRTAKAPDEFNKQQKDYIKKLRSGISFDLGAYYKVDNNFAVGLKYNRYSSKMELNNIFIESTPAGNSGFGSISDDISISYYGASIMFITDSGPHIFSIEAGLGYMDYTNDAEALGSYKFKGGNVGGALTISYKYAFTKHFAVGPQVGILGTSLSNIDIEGPGGYRETLILENEQKENLTRIDLGITAMYRF